MRNRLTKRFVDAVKPGEKVAFHWDSDLPGFGLKVYPSGARSYVLQYERHGRSHRVTIGRHGAPWTPKTARDEAVRLRGELVSGKDPAEKRRKKRSAPTVRDLADRYLEEHAIPKKAPRSVQNDRWHLDKHILPVLGDRKLSDLTRADVARFHHGLRKTRYNANRALALLSTMMNLAERLGLRPDGSNPCRHVQKFKEEGRERFLSDGEFGALGKALAKAEKSGSESVYSVAAIRLLLLTGCRLSEILTLRWQDVRLEDRLLLLPTSKTGPKPVAIGDTAAAVLTALPRPQDNAHVLPARTGPGHLVGIQKPWQRIRSAAGLEDVRLHDLRHSYASAAARTGHSLVVIGGLLGHQDNATTDRYAHLADSTLRDAANEVSGVIDQLMSPKKSKRKR